MAGVFFTKHDGRRADTPLFLVLLIIETTDVAFALDSIPAVLAISRDAFLIFTSNIFAILGLRSLLCAPGRDETFPLPGVRAGSHSRLYRVKNAFDRY